jgi:PTS system nitrogen regulatory IIA component
MPLRQLVHCFSHTAQAVFPVIQPGTKRLLGVVDGRLLRRTIGEIGVDTLLIANDFIAPAATVHARDSLHDAVSRMSSSGFDDLLVVDAKRDGALIGIISRREVVTAYHRRMLERAPSQGSRSGTWEAVDPATLPKEPPASPLMSALRLGSVIPRLKAHTPREAMTEMVERADLPPELDRARLLQLLLEREALSSTGVGNGIALPHPNAQELAPGAAPRILVGLPRRPIEWGSFDQQPVDTICVLVCASGDVHLELLGGLARALNDPELRRLLQQRASRKRILGRFEELDAEGGAPQFA